MGASTKANKINKISKNINNMKINHFFLAEELPIIKAQDKGMDALTNVELLSILIGSRKGDLSKPRQLLQLVDNNLRSLAKFDMQEFDNILTQCNATRLQAAFELTKRLQAEDNREKTDLGNARTIYEYMKPYIGDLNHEESWVLLMNNNLKLIKAVRLSSGGFTETSMDIRMAIKECVLNNATVMALSHNHPSGSTSPSKQDDTITDAFQKACKLMRITFVDHVIVGDGDFYSYHDHGRYC